MPRRASSAAISPAVLSMNSGVASLDMARSPDLLFTRVPDAVARRPRSRPAVGEQGRRTEARELLAPFYGWFTEGLDTTDLKEARRCSTNWHELPTTSQSS